MGTRDPVEAAHGDPVAVHREQEDGDAVASVGAVAHALDPREEVTPLGPQGPRRPDLLAGDAVPLAVGHRARLHVGEVGARVRFAEALAPEALALGDQGEVQRLLLRGAVVEDRRADPVGAVVLPATRLEVRPHLFADGDRRREVEVLASVLGGPVGHQQALARQHLAEPVAQLEVGRVVGEGTEPVLGEMFGDQRAQPRPQRAHVLGVFVDKGIRGVVGCHPRHPENGRGRGRHYRCVGSRGVEPADETLSPELLEWIAADGGWPRRPGSAPSALAGQLVRRRRRCPASRPSCSRREGRPVT